MTKPTKILTRSVKLYLTLLIISTGAILYGTLFPVSYDVPRSLLGMDKLVHLIMFGAWTFFFGLVRFLKDKFKLIPVFIVGTLFGLIVEVLQYLLPTGRSPEFMDFIADLSGTGLAILVLYILAKKVPEFNTDPAS
ncbi:MAG: VanZ family protein [Gracilimonas sp.]|uniref:VanZ family protein n=1 Tax=Gracilimonas sp. TaxID=1974203 RepID=UPI001B2C77FB|nr:VanZ family protein [Gracilimonas sp.]MBO6585309.1 VanZ family protein [Gracilimonas sp.]MBO6616305.1 VanZ family protein [Gracilimonas sp.]